jgi:hypothetical protein
MTGWWKRLWGGRSWRLASEEMLRQVLGTERKATPVCITAYAANIAGYGPMVPCFHVQALDLRPGRRVSP